MSVVKYKGMEVDPTRLNESVTVRLPSAPKGSLKESFGGNDTVSPRIEAIHAGPTKNYMYYTAEKLKGNEELGSGVYSWTSPYGKPVIYNHDTFTETTGRVERAAYADYTQAGRPGIIVVPKITEPKAVQAIRDGRLLTVSIGGTTDAAICSICGNDIINEGFCGHMKGEKYDGETATWIAGNIWFDELSWVNVPADENAMVVDVETSAFGESETKEHVEEEEISLNEFYNIPRSVTVTESIVKHETEEGSEKMTEEETKDVVIEKEKDELPEEEEVKAVEKEVVEPEEVDKEEPEEVEKKVTDDTKSEEPVKDAPAEKEVAVDESAFIEDKEIPSDSNIARMQAENESLSTQVDALTEELRKEYEEKVLAELGLEEEAKEKFATRLSGRSLTSLKEMLDDIKDGFYAVEKTEEPKKEARKIEKVNSPITESEKETRSVSESDRVNFYAKLFGTK